MKLQDKKAIVTGSDPIAKSIALEFANEGADVAIVDLDSDSVHKIAKEVNDLGKQGLPIVANVTKKKDVENMVNDVESKFGRINIFVNANATDKPCSILEVSEELWDEVISDNLKSRFLCSQAVAKSMIEHKEKGNIISMTSISGTSPEIGHHAYSPSRAGAILLMQLLAVELAQYHIRANAISPGPTNTPGNAVNYKTEDDWKWRAECIPLRNLIEPVDLAKAAVFLASDDARYITGANLTVDGGSAPSLFYFIPQRGVKDFLDKPPFVQALYKDNKRM